MGDYRSIIEGICPTCGSALERREDNGHCPKCNVGWSYSPNQVDIHMTPVIRSIQFGDEDRAVKPSEVRFSFNPAAADVEDGRTKQ